MSEYWLWDQLAEPDLKSVLYQLDLGKLVNIPAPLSPHLQNRDNISTCVAHSTDMRIIWAKTCEVFGRVPGTYYKLNDVSYYFYEAL